MAEAGDYFCRVTGDCPVGGGPEDSATAALTLLDATNITINPIAPAPTCLGDTVQFDVQAEGSNLVFTWQHDNGGGFVDLSPGGDLTQIDTATTSQLEVANVAIVNAGDYRCKVEGDCAPVQIFSLAVTLTVVTDTAITADPVSQDVCPSGTAQFSVTAEGANLAFDWLLGGFPVILDADHVQMDTATTSTLTITNAGPGDAGDYTVEVTGDCPVLTTVTSPPATLTLLETTTVTDPAVQDVCPGDSAMFTVLPVTGSNLAFQWQRDTGGGMVNVIDQVGKFTGATTETLFVDNVDVTDAGDYQCVVTAGDCGTPTSLTAALTVQTETAITGHPAGVFACDGDTNVDLAVIAVGENLVYQWQHDVPPGGWQDIFDGASYAGTGTDILTVVTINTNTAGDYRCVVTGDCPGGDVISDVATITIVTDNQVTQPPQAAEACTGGTAVFSVEAIGAGLTFQWKFDDGGGEVDINSGGDFTVVDTATTSTLTIVNVDAFNVGEYFCVISGNCGGDVTSVRATLTLLPGTAIQIAGHPDDWIGCPGLDATFTVVADGDSLTYQWQFDDGGGFVNLINGGDIEDATMATLTVRNVDALNEGFYRCEVDGSCGAAVLSDEAELQLLEENGVVTDPLPAAVCQGDPADFTVEALGSNTTFQWQRDTGGGFVDINDGDDGGDIVVVDTPPTSALTVNNTEAADLGDYRCLINGDCGVADVPSASAALTILTGNGVTDPANQDVCPGGMAMFAVTGTGVNLTYQWQFDDGITGFMDLIDVFGKCSGTTTDTLAVENADANDVGQYRCVVSGDCGADATSNPADLTLLVETTTTDPAPQTVCPGDTAIFSVTATGVNNTFQWEFDDGLGFGFQPIVNGGDISGVDTNTLQIDNVDSANEGFYRCFVDGDCGDDTSAAAELSVIPGTTITDPLDQAVCFNDPASFSIVPVAGSGLAFQWQFDDGVLGWQDLFDGVNVTGVNTETLDINSVGPGNLGWYRCVVTAGDCGTPTSAAAELTPLNGTTLTNPVAQDLCPGDLAMFTVAPTTGSGLTFRWQFDDGLGGGFVDLFDGGGISGAATDTLQINNVTAADAGDYRCVVTAGSCGTPTSAPATLTVGDDTIVGTDPVDEAICVGGDATFSVAATGSGILAYQWQYDDGVSGWQDLSNIPGYISGATTDTLQITGTVGVEDGTYRCAVTGGCGTVNSAGALLTFLADTQVTGDPANQDICPLGVATFTVVAIGENLTFEWRLFGVLVPLDLNHVQTDTATSSTLEIFLANAGDEGDYTAVVSGDCGLDDTSAVATLTLLTDTQITVEPPANPEACPGDAVNLSVTAIGENLTYRWQFDDSVHGFQDLNNGVTVTGVTTDTLTMDPVTAANAGVYRCVVSGDCGAHQTSAESTLTIGTTTVIMTQPNDQWPCAGETVTLNVDAIGTNLTYQWQFDDGLGGGFVDLVDGGTISGATTDTLQIDNVTAADEGNYRCQIVADCGNQTTSEPALVLLADTVINTDPADVVVCPGDNATFTVGATGENLTYRWQADFGGGFFDMFDGGDISGATTDTLQIANVDAANVASYRCYVMGDCGDAFSASAQLTLEPVVTDCNTNGVDDACDILVGTSNDCNNNGVPDECEPDCQPNGVPDDCDVDPTDPDGDTFVSEDCNNNGIPDECEPDCQPNGIPDDCDVDPTDPDGDTFVSEDCNNNGIPDECEADCNTNGVPDDCDIDPTDPDGDTFVSEDCNNNGVPDECDVDPTDPDGDTFISLDCQPNGIPDECDGGCVPPPPPPPPGPGPQPLPPPPPPPPGTGTIDPNGNVTVWLGDEEDPNAMVIITGAEEAAGAIITITLDVGDPNTAPNGTFAGFAGDGLALPLVLDVQVNPELEPGTFVATVILCYSEEMLGDLDENELRLHIFNEETGEWELAGTNDVGVSAPTGIVGDYGIDPISNCVWVVLDHLTLFAAGVPLPIPPEPEPEPEPLPEPGPDLTITTLPSADTVIRGGVITYVYEIINLGLVDATGVVVEVLFNGNVAISSYSNAGTTSGATFAWDVFDLGAGETVKRIMTIRVNDDVPEPITLIFNDVAVSDDGSAGEDPDLSSNTDSEATILAVTPEPPVEPPSGQPVPPSEEPAPEPPVTCGVFGICCGMIDAVTLMMMFVGMATLRTVGRRSF